MGGFRNTLHIEGDFAIIRNRHNRGEILIDAADARFFKTHNLHIHARGDTTTVTACCKAHGTATKLSRLILDAPKYLVVDHIDGNPLDNRRENLRLVSQRDNRRNSVKPAIGATSQYKGVCQPSGRKRWLANIYDGRRIYLGTFGSERDAAEAYDTAARKLFGECAALNFPRAGEQSAHRCPTGAFANPSDRDAIEAQLAKLRPASDVA